MKILIVAAHPDDEVLGVGGTMAVLSEKNDVFTAIVTEGCSTQYKDCDIDSIIRQKQSDAIKANEILGVKEVFFGNLPDMQLDKVAHTEINDFIGNTVRTIMPDIVFTHYYGDVNLDHRRVYESTMVAVRPVGNIIRKVYIYETPSATEWNSYDKTSIFVPNTFFDISSAIAQKTEALMCYQHEIRQYPHPRSEQALHISAASRGIMAGLEYAEAFCLVRDITKEL